MTQPLHIDVVADISCPFCAMTVAAFGEAIAAIGEDIAIDVTIQPFHLNPAMSPAGENFFDYLAAKSGAPRDAVKQRIAGVAQRAAELGFTITVDEATRVRNTFDAHRLLRWAAGSGRQYALARALFAAHFTHGGDVSAPEQLAGAAALVGLDADAAHQLLAGDDQAAEVREAEREWRDRGVSSVPAIFVNGELVFSGAQDAATFERSLRALAADPVNA